MYSKMQMPMKMKITEGGRNAVGVDQARLPDLPHPFQLPSLELSMGQYGNLP
jgi:hypothetical protein